MQICYDPDRNSIGNTIGSKVLRLMPGQVEATEMVGPHKFLNAKFAVRTSGRNGGANDET
jgi:hypothetical protein